MFSGFRCFYLLNSRWGCFYHKSETLQLYHIGLIQQDLICSVNGLVLLYDEHFVSHISKQNRVMCVYVKYICRIRALLLIIVKYVWTLQQINVISHSTWSNSIKEMLPPWWHIQAKWHTMYMPRQHKAMKEQNQWCDQRVSVEIFWCDKSLIIVVWSVNFVTEQFLLQPQAITFVNKNTLALFCTTNKRHTYLRETQSLLCSIMTRKGLQRNPGPWRIPAQYTKRLLNYFRQIQCQMPGLISPLWSK